MTYDELLTRVIDDGIAEVKMAYADPGQAHKRDGAIAGFEACRGKIPVELAALYVAAEAECRAFYRVNGTDNSERTSESYWRARYYALQVEFVCNVISVGLAQAGFDPILSWLPTVRGAYKYHAVVGNESEEAVPGSGQNPYIKRAPVPSWAATPDHKPMALHLLPASAYPFTIRIFSGKTGEVIWSKTVQLPRPSTKLAALEIPGYSGTEHTPVRVEIEYADGTTEER